MNISFILVEPAVPENVGAAARAMKTMGIMQMRLVQPCNYLSTKARMLAHASNDILENAIVYNTLQEAIADIDFVVGTTARRRTKRVDYHQVENLPDIILSKGDSIKSVAVIFGREETGLTNNEISLCDILTTISMVSSYPSLNLGQAVMLYAYTLSVLVGKKASKAKGKKNQAGWNALKNKTEHLLPQIGITSDDLIYTRIMERFALLCDTDVNLLHSIIAGIEPKLKE